MTIRTIILSCMTYLALLPMITQAKIDYISLHEIESPARQPLSVRLNIVEKDEKSRLKFTLVNQNIETILKYNRLNDYMLRLKSSHYVIGKASILVYEFVQNTWKLTYEVNISNSLMMNEVDKKVLSKVAKIKTQCRLIRKPKETLWSIASRYKNQWSVDVYSAMLAIYKSNQNKFAKQHIGQLLNNAELACPTKNTIDMMGRKLEMKAEFIRLNKPQ